MRKRISVYPITDIMFAGMTIEQQVRALIKTMRTQQALAACVDVSQSTVHRWLKGAEPEGVNRDKIVSLYEELVGSPEFSRMGISLPASLSKKLSELEPDARTFMFDCWEALVDKLSGYELVPRN
jgi:hypothetical protein